MQIVCFTSSGAEGKATSVRKRAPTTRIVRPLRGGQITIPAEFRKQLGITEESVLQLTLEGKELRIRAVDIDKTAEGSPWFAELYDQFAPVREEASSLNEAEIDAAINEAVEASRRERRGA